ncbi:hypothetical protein Tco_1034205 [Tanacetum coccineum]
MDSHIMYQVQVPELTSTPSADIPSCRFLGSLAISGNFSSMVPHYGVCRYDTVKDDTVEDYLPVAKKPIPKVIFKSLIPNKRCVLGLANVETWDNIVKKYQMRTHERCADKSKGKRKVSC